MAQEKSRSEKRKRNRKIRNRIAFGLLAIFSIAAVLYSGIQLMNYYEDHRSEMELKEELLQLRSEVDMKSAAEKSDNDAEKEAEKLRAFYRNMKEKNEDYVCWINLGGADIDYPVVWRDNSFYLNHNFEGEKNRHGSIFLDENCTPEEEVLLLHGHHMKDGTMFGGLKKYKDREFCEKNREIVLCFEEEYAAYRIFAIAQVDLTAEGSFAFEVLPKTLEEKMLYIEGLNRASFWYDETVVANDVERESLLILSTCDYGTEDERLLVAAKKIE